MNHKYPYNKYEAPNNNILLDTLNYSVKNIFMFISSKEEKYLNECFEKKGNDFILNFEKISDMIKNDIIRIIVGNDDINNFELLMDNNIIQNYNKLDECFKIAVINKSIKILKYLLNMGIDMCHLNNYAIIAGSAIENNADFLHFVIKNGGDINAQNNSPIKFAAYIGCINNFMFLIKNGVDIYNVCEYVCKISLNRFHVEIIEYLVKIGIDFKQYEDVNNFFRESIRQVYNDSIKLCIDMQLDASVISKYDLQCMLQRDILPETLKMLINYGIDFTSLNKIKATTESEIIYLKCYDLFVENGVNPKTLALINYKAIDE
uniref:Putative ankyrin repeat protein n=1 Tax=Moumouvirus sp. 'Monve' TaxID=1128131 RepID=H2EDP4_9VIRU|nr:putative ankyrin repeat protein [Moumouvirus Monve]